MALMQTHKDDFNNNSLGGIWSDFGGAQTVETNQEMQITSTLASGYYGIDSGATTYDLTDSYAFCQYVGPATSSIVSFEAYPVNLSDAAGNNSLQWMISPQGGTIKAFKKVAGVTTQVLSTAYSSTTHRFFRIRESGGTTYWDTSANGTVWTNRHSEANPITVTALKAGILQGTWQVEGSTATARFDNFNLLDNSNFMLGCNF